MANASITSIAASLLPDGIRKNITDGTFTIVPQNNSEKWNYQQVLVSNAANKNLIDSGGSLYLEPAATEARGGSIASGDLIRFVYIIHTGYSDAAKTSTTTEGVMLHLDAETTNNYNVGDGIFIPSGSSWFAAMPFTTVASLHARTCAVSSEVPSANGSGSAFCEVYALIDDISV
jgi:hypothetical protein